MWIGQSFLIQFSIYLSCYTSIQILYPGSTHRRGNISMLILFFFSFDWAHLTRISAPDLPTLLDRSREISKTVTPAALLKGKPESIIPQDKCINKFFLLLFLSMNPFNPPHFFCHHYQSILRLLLKKWHWMGLLEKQKTK